MLDYRRRCRQGQQLNRTKLRAPSLRQSSGTYQRKIQCMLISRTQVRSLYIDDKVSQQQVYQLLRHQSFDMLLDLVFFQPLQSRDLYMLLLQSSRVQLLELSSNISQSIYCSYNYYPARFQLQIITLPTTARRSTSSFKQLEFVSSISQRIRRTIILLN